MTIVSASSRIPALIKSAPVITNICLLSVGVSIPPSTMFIWSIGKSKSLNPVQLLSRGGKFPMSFCAASISPRVVKGRAFPVSSGQPCEPISGVVPACRPRTRSIYLISFLVKS